MLTVCGSVTMTCMYLESEDLSPKTRLEPFESCSRETGTMESMPFHGGIPGQVEEQTVACGVALFDMY